MPLFYPTTLSRYRKKETELSLICLHFHPVNAFPHSVSSCHFVPLPPSAFLYFSTRFQCPTAGVAHSFLTTNFTRNHFLLFYCWLCNFANFATSFFRFSSLPKKQFIFTTLHLCDSFIRHPCILSNPSSFVCSLFQWSVHPNFNSLLKQRSKYKSPNLQNGNLAIWQNVQSKLLITFRSA